MKLNKKGFTLIELVIVIIIIAILAAVAIPRFRDLAGHAREASERATVTAVRQAITIYRAYNELEGITPRIPFRLDGVTGAVDPGTPATDAAPFFTVIMEAGGGVTTGWNKLTPPTDREGYYWGPHGGRFAYESDDGSFAFTTRVAR